MLPVALVEAVLKAFTDPGDLVFEPFCSSGTPLVAADGTVRKSQRDDHALGETTEMIRNAPIWRNSEPWRQS